MDTTPNSDASAAASEDIPATDLPSDTAQPETQGTDPVEAELGDEGQGDLAPEDLGDERPDDDSKAKATPQDLRTEAPTDPPVSNLDGSEDVIGDGT